MVILLLCIIGHIYSVKFPNEYFLLMSNQSRRRGSDSRPMLFSAWNYKVLIAGLLLVVVGFTAMYMENEVQGFISLYISPIMIMAGYITVIFAIMKHDQDNIPKSENAP